MHATPARLIAILGDLNRAEQLAELSNDGFADWQTLADALPEYDADLSSHLDESDPVAFALTDGSVVAWDDTAGAWLLAGEMPSSTLRPISRYDLNPHTYGDHVNRAALENAADDADRLEFHRPAGHG